MSSGPDTSPKHFREMAGMAAGLIEAYYTGLPENPVMPLTTAETLRALLAEPLPRSAMGFEEALAIVRDVVYPLSRHNGHPRFFGYVASPGTAVAALGDFLAAALNANVTSWRSAPAATEMEHVVIGWLKDALRYPAEAGGLLVSGGSMANFSGLAAARTAHAPASALSGTHPRMRVYVSEEGHFSIHKAARLLGLGSENVQTIRTDEAFRIDPADLERRVRADRDAGFVPMCVVANAGTVNTGSFDSIAEVADVAERYGLWLHVDGAYGAFASLAPSVRSLFAGIESADSVSLDPHKWLYSSMGCGCILYRNPEIARATFAHDAEYTRTVGWSQDEAFAFWDFGPELSRPFRALAIWLQFKVYGAEALGRAIEANLACARYFQRLVDATDDFEMLAPVALSIFCFRYHPPGYSGDLDALNERVLVELQRGGSSYLSNARLRGKFALRGCVLNYRTTEQDMNQLLADVRQAAARVLEM